MWDKFKGFFGGIWLLQRPTRKPGSKKGYRSKQRNQKPCKMSFGTFSPKKPFNYGR